MKGYRKLLLCKKKIDNFDVVPKESDYSAALAKDANARSSDDDKLIELGKLNQKGFTELILSINTESDRGKIAFRLVKNSKSSDYPEGNCKVAWDRLVAKYAPKSLPSLLKYKKKFENSKLDSAEKDTEDWISELEGLTVDIESIDASSAISDRDLMVKILNNLPSEYDVILDGLESRLNKSGDDALTLEDIREKLGTRYARIKTNEEEVDMNGEEKAFVAWSKYKKMQRFENKNGNYRERNGSTFEGRCWYCHQRGHKAFDCGELKKDMIAKKKSDFMKMEKSMLAFDRDEDERFPGYNEELGF